MYIIGVEPMLGRKQGKRIWFPHSYGRRDPSERECEVGGLEAAMQKRLRSTYTIREGVRNGRA